MIKTCTQCKKEFKLITQELEFYKKMKVTTPDRCPACRQLRREQSRNDYQFYKYPCANCGKQMVSTVNPKKGYVVYCSDCYAEFRATVDLTKI